MKRRFLFWFSVSVIASAILFYIWEWLQYEADRARQAPLGYHGEGCCDYQITSFDLAAYRREGLI